MLDPSHLPPPIKISCEKSGEFTRKSVVEASLEIIRASLSGSPSAGFLDNPFNHAVACLPKMVAAIEALDPKKEADTS